MSMCIMDYIYIYIYISRIFMMPLILTWMIIVMP